MILPQFPDYEINVSLYENVQNAADIQSRVAELPYAFIDANMICSVEQLTAAIYRTLMESTYNRLRTKTFHSEVLLALSPTSNIGEAFKKFGVKSTSERLIVVQINENGSQKIDDSLVQGDSVEFKDENLQSYCDVDAIRKVYKLDKSFQPSNTSDLSRALVDAIQLRGL